MILELVAVVGVRELKSKIAVGFFFAGACDGGRSNEARLGPSRRLPS